MRAGKKMSRIVGNNVPTRGDKILNPKTNRMIVVGGNAWKKIVAEGIIDGVYKDPTQLTDIKENEDINAQKARLDKTLPLGTHAVKGRGRYKGKMVRRKKCLFEDDMNKVASNGLAKALKAGKVDINNLSMEELQEALQTLTKKEVERTRNPKKDESDEELEIPKLTRERTSRVRGKNGRFQVRKAPPPPRRKSRRIKNSRRSRRASPPPRREYNTDDFETDNLTTDLSTADFDSDSDSEVDANHSNHWGYSDSDTEEV